MLYQLSYERAVFFFFGERAGGEEVTCASAVVLAVGHFAATQTIAEFETPAGPFWDGERFGARGRVFSRGPAAPAAPAAPAQGTDPSKC